MVVFTIPSPTKIAARSTTLSVAPKNNNTQNTTSYRQNDDYSTLQSKRGKHHTSSNHGFVRDHEGT